MRKLIAFLILVFLSNCLPAQIPTSGLTGYWPFSSTQFANDYSGNGNNGTVHGATLTTDRFGNCQQAYKFNGTSNYIEVPNSSTIDMNNTDFTIALWVKTYATDTTGAVLNKNLHTGAWSGYFITTNDNDPGYCPVYKHAYFYVAAGTNNEACSNGPICIDTTWHFLTGVYKYATNQAYFYVDGVMQAMVGKAAGTISNTADLFFGGAGNINSAYFTGVIDAIRIYQRALSAAEITQLYNEPNPGSVCNTQICSGNLGANVYFDNFGSNSTLYAPALPAGETNYPYLTGTPANGSYVVSYTSNPSNTLPPQGAYVHAGDHTGNSFGCMMVVNSDYPPDTVYTKLITGLCPNTTYIFSSYLANNDDPTQVGPVCGSSYVYANVKMQVEYPAGTVQGSVSTGNLPLAANDASHTWVQAGFVFTTVAGQTSVILSMINNAPGGCGNDYVVDDISLSPCGPGIALNVIPNQNIFCAGQAVTLQAIYTSGSYVNPQYQWQFSNNGGSTWTNIAGATSQTYSINSVTAAQGGMYQLIAAENGSINLPSCSILAGPLSFSVTTGTGPVISVTGNTSLCSGQDIILKATGATTYTWSTGATTSATVSTIDVKPNVNTTYTVTGSTGGCTGQAVTTVSVNPTPTLTIAGDTSICSGQSNPITASGANTYTWNTGATTASINLYPNVTTSYIVIGGVSTCTSQAVFKVKVAQSPTVSIASNNSVICSGKTISLTASGATNYVWNTGAATANINVSPTITTSYSVIGSMGTCTNQAIATITVNPSPATVITGNMPICSGQNISLLANGANSYKWNTGQTTAGINVSPNLTTTYTVIGTVGSCTDQAVATVSVTATPTVSINGNLNACSGHQNILTANGATNYVWNDGETTASINANQTTTTSYTVMGSIGTCTGQAIATVTVNASPVVSVTGNTLICMGQNTTLTASGAISYNWNTGATTASIVVSPTINAIYTVIGKNGTCSDAASIAVSTSNTSLTGNNIICQGKSTTLTASGASSYLWNTGATTASVVLNPLVTTTYTVVGTTGTCTTQAVETILVNSVPVTTITGNTVICSGQSTTLTASGASTYVWSTGATTYSITVHPKTNTSYYVIGTTGTCTYQTIDSIHVNPSPTAHFTFNPNPATIVDPLIYFTNQSLNYTAWCWNFGDGSAEDSIDINPTHYYNTEVGNSYQASLTLINQNGCKDVITVLLVIQPEFTFYIPNAFTPNKDTRNDLFTGSGIGITSYEIWIFDRWGACVFSSNDISKGWDGTLKNKSEPAKEDIYVWKVEVADLQKTVHEYTGTVTLIK